MSPFVVHPVAALAGSITLPPDKSVAHRAALLAALADGTTEIVGYSQAADPQSTLACLRALGVAMEDGEGGSLLVHGRGLQGLHGPASPLDCGNSGTTMRLLAGILAGQPFDSTLVGDASLSRRPMRRIAEPLGQMGATLSMTDGHAPLRLTGQALRGITYPLPVASAQVKSCVLLAGLFAKGLTTVVETVPSRDHTERMLGLSAVEMDGKRYLTVEGGRRVAHGLRVVPRDFSAAAFFLVAGAIAPHAILELPAVGLNPTRSALLDVLRAMGANIAVRNERERGHEPIADLVVHHGHGLHGVQLSGPIIANLIDEIPVLAVAAACADGVTEIRDAEELRVKETDRLKAVAEMLTTFGVKVVELQDGLIIHGRGGDALTGGGTVNPYDDHRLAMSAAVAALVADRPTTILDPACAAVSFPSFWDELRGLGVEVTA